jgi:glycosyltransferase involved in cell wall biosynthesis
MLVSFVIPTRNQVAFIRKCIDRCLEQALPDAEVIVMDGLSTDGTQEVLAAYGSKIRWVSEADAGQSDAVNKGVRQARGEIIAWVNSDDYYAGPDVLRRVIALFAAEPELDIVYGDALMVDSEGKPIRPAPGRVLHSPKQVLIRPAGFATQPAVFFRKRLFEEVGGLANDLHWAMDYDLWIRMLLRGRKFRYVPELFACATYHPTAKSVKGLWSQVRELCRIKKKYVGAFRLGLADRLRMRRGMLSLYAYWAAVKLGLRRAV